jgi:hypothetical protein
MGSDPAACLRVETRSVQRDPSAALGIDCDRVHAPRCRCRVSAKTRQGREHNDLEGRDGLRLSSSSRSHSSAFPQGSGSTGYLDGQ